MLNIDDFESDINVCNQNDSSILPQYFDQQNCSCGAKWANKCGAFPSECPTCAGPAPTPAFSCSTTESGWWAESVILASGDVADFTGTTSQMPALILDEFVVPNGAKLLFGLNSAVQTRGRLFIEGDVEFKLSVDDTVFLSNQISGDFYHKNWLAVSRNYITSFTPFAQREVLWNPSFSIPEVCHLISANSSTKVLPNPFELLTLYQATFLYLPAVRFRCSSWVIVIGVFGGVIIVVLVVFIACYVYTKSQEAKRKKDRRPLLR